MDLQREITMVACVVRKRVDCKITGPIGISTVVIISLPRAHGAPFVVHTMF